MAQSSEELVRVSCSGEELLFYAPDGDDHIQRVLRCDHRLYEESALIDMLARRLKRGVVIDVGANIGNHTVFFGKLLKRRVIALEPYERAFRVLERNVELNDLSDRVTLLHKAAGRQRGRGEMTPPPEHNWGQARVRPTGSGPVEVIQLDDLEIKGPVALLKVDVEGMEADVLKGAWRLLKRKQPVLYVEAQTSEHYAVLRRLLRPIGYQMVRRFNHTPTYVFVACRNKKQTIDALLEKTEALAFVEDLAIAQREMSRLLSEQEKAVTSKLQAIVESASQRLYESLTEHVHAIVGEHAMQLLGELRRGRSELGNDLNRLRDELQTILSNNEKLDTALKALRAELQRSIAAMESPSPNRNQSSGVTLRLPLEKVHLHVNLGNHGLKPESRSPAIALSARGLPGLIQPPARETCYDAAGNSDAKSSSQDASDKVSVIMTTYNSAAYVKKAVTNVLEQTHDDLELIVVDDASSDNTFEILLELAQSDPRVRPIKLFTNRGTYWCKNYGITRSTGRYLAFQDSDDVSAPDRLELQLRELKKTNCVMCTCNYVRMDSAGQIVLNRGREERKAIMAPLFDKQEVLRHVGYFDSVRTSADDEFNRRVGIVYGQERICHIDKPLYQATVRQGSLTNDARTKSDIGAADDSSTSQAFLSAPRREYVRQFSAWHDALKKGKEAPQIDFPQLRRRFPAPARLLPDTYQEDCHVTASLASYPPRCAALELSVASILPQVDFLNVYLNGYDETPKFLQSPQIHVIHSREYGDLRDNGKFFFLDSVPWGYHFTIDDDIIYPPNYVQKMVLKIEQYDRKAIVGCHGVIFANPIVEFMKNRRVFHFKTSLACDRVVNLLGTGTTAYHVGAISLNREDFCEPGMADLWLAVAAKRQKVPMIAIERPGGWLTPITEADESSLYSEALTNSHLQTTVAQNEEPWRLDELCLNYPLIEQLLTHCTREQLKSAGLDLCEVPELAEMN